MTSGEEGHNGGGADELDAVLHLEEDFHKEGISASQTASAQRGHADGRTLGWTSGAALSAEMNFYHGAATAVTTLAQTYGNEKVSDKAVESARRLSVLCEQTRLHVVGNDSQLDMDQLMQDARALFRVLSMQTGLLVRYDRRPSKMDELSF